VVVVAAVAVADRSGALVADKSGAAGADKGGAVGADKSGAVGAADRSGALATGDPAGDVLSSWRSRRMRCWEGVAVSRLRNRGRRVGLWERRVRLARRSTRCQEGSSSSEPLLTHASARTRRGTRTDTEAACC
jgi:hypothetical protein